MLKININTGKTGTTGRKLTTDRMSAIGIIEIRTDGIHLHRRIRLTNGKTSNNRRVIIARHKRRTTIFQLDRTAILRRIGINDIRIAIRIDNGTDNPFIILECDIISD